MDKCLDPTHEFADHISDDPPTVFYCKFCKHKITAGITRLKHHLTGTKKDVKICAQVPANVKQACNDMLVTKLENESLVYEIGRMGESQEDVVNQELESAAGSNSQPQTIGPMNKFINLEARQSTLESSYREAREKYVRKIGRCVYALGLLFNIIQTPYWKEMIEKVR